nr:hypothetical protein [Desulfurococcales archaeon]
IASVDSSQADPSMLCKEYSPELVEEHSPGADPCGERGEFHTFVFSAPFFWKPLRVERGLVLKEGDYYYCMLRLRGLP